MKSTRKKSHKSDVLAKDEFDARHGKFRVTMYVDLDVLDEIRKSAAAKRLPYQTYINQLLRKFVFGSDETETIRRIVREELKKKVI